MKFLEEKSSYDHVNTEHLIHSVQSTIRTSEKLKLKVKEYFDKLDITIKIMEQVRFVFNSIHKFEFLSHIDKYEYLQKSLEITNLHQYYITWFQCFLANIQETDDQEQYKILLEYWLDQSTSNPADLMSILMSIDELLVTFDKPDTDYLHSYFINRITDICFKQGYLK